MSLKEKIVLVTGGSGFIGKNLIERLIEKEAQVINVSRMAIKYAENISIDLTKTDFSFLDDLKIDYAVHLASFSSPSRSINREETIKLNFESTKKLFDKLKKIGIKKGIFMSSSVVYEESQSDLAESSPYSINPGFYAESKILAERYLKNIMENGFPLIIFRLSNCYGPGQQWKKEEVPTLVPQLITSALIKNKIELQNRNPVRDYIFIGDVCNAILESLEVNYSGFLNLGTGVGTSSGEIVDIISDIIGCGVRDLDLKVGGPKRVVLDISRTKSILKWKPDVSVKEGISRAINYYKGVI